MKKTNTFRRCFAMMLAVVMCLSALPLSIFAAEETAATYTKVTDVTDLAVGDQIIVVAANADYALSTEQKTNNRGQTAVTKDGNTVAISNDTQIITLEAGTVDGTFAFNVGGGYLYAAGQSKAQNSSKNYNYLKTENTLSANSSWLITIADDGIASVVAQGENGCNTLQYNTNSGLFSCYVSGQAAISIYKLGASTGGEEPAPSTPDPSVPGEPESEVIAVADGTYVLWNAGANKAMSALNESYSYGYAPAVDVALTDGVLSGYENTAIFTIAGGAEDGTFTIADSYGRYLYMSGEYNSFNLTTDAATAGAEWVLESAAEGVYYVKNVEKEKYLAYSATYGNFGAYADISDGSVITLTSAVSKEEEQEPDAPTGTTATLVTSVTKLAAGDKIVIVASGSDAALSTNQKSNNRGEAAVTKSEDGTTVTFDQDTQIITLEAGKVDGTFAFNVDGGYLYAASSSSNYLKTEATLSDNSSWLVEIADGVATIKAQGTNTRNWLRYNSTSSLFACYASGQADVSIYKLGADEEETGVVLVDALSHLDKVYMYYPNEKLALSDTASGKRLTGVAGTVTDNKLEVADGMVELIVAADENGCYSFITADGKYLTSAETGNSLNFADAASDYSLWTLEKADGGWYIRNANAVYNGSAQYIEYYSGFTTYGYNAAYDAQYIYQFYKSGVAEAVPEGDIQPEEPTDTLISGEYVIWNHNYNMALSSTAAGNYNAGVAVTLNGDVLTGYGSAEIWNVTVSEDGKTCTLSQLGVNLGVNTGYTSMSMGAPSDVWEIIELGDGTYNLKSEDRGTYMEWYAQYSNWSTYGTIYDDSKDLFQLTFTPVERVYAVDSSVVENVAQWGGMTSADNTSFVNGDKYVSGDEKDTEDIYTAVVSGKTVAPWSKGGNDDAPLYYLGGTGVGSGTDDYLQMQVNASGWGDMTLSFRLRSSKAGSGSFQLQYSADGGQTWKKFSTGTYSYSWTSWGQNEDGESVVTGSGVSSGTISDGIARTSLAPATSISFEFDVPAGADNCGELLIRLVPGGTKANGATGSIDSNSTVRLDSVVLSGSPIVADSITSYVYVTPDGKEDQAVGTALTMTCATEGAAIYYRVNGGDWTIYNAADKPILRSLPCNVEAYAVSEGRADSVIRLYQYAAGTVENVKMTPNGGSVYIPADTEKIILSCTTEGATIYYMVTGDEAYSEYTGPIEINKGFGELTVTAYAVKNGFKDSAVTERTFTERQNPEFHIYFGQLHSHTSISDGAGTVESAFAYAYNVKNLDFLAVTDHSNSFDNESSGVLSQDGSSVSSEWKEGHEVAQAITDDTFVGLYGFEMTWSNGLGHINTYNTPGWQSRTQTDYKTFATALQNYYATLATVPESISQFNHPGTTFGDFSDFSYYSETTDELITLIEVGNGEGAIGSSGYFPSYEYYTRALDRGWHVAPTNNQDNHKGLWGDANTGRSVILADSLTEENIYDAMRNYRVYATEDNDLNIYYTLDGNIMGSTLDGSDVGETVSLSVRLSDVTDAAAAKVQVIVNGGYALETKNATCNETVSFEVSSNYNYYYIKVTQADGDIAVTAPVWIGEVEAIGISSLTAQSELTIAGEEQTFTLELFNNEKKALDVESIVFTDKDSGKVLWEDKTIASVPSEGTASCSFCYTFETDGIYTIRATVQGTLNGVAKEYTQDLEVTVMPQEITSLVIVDGTHYNDYVTGYYGGNTANMTTIAAEQGIKVHVETEKITAEMLADCSLLVISAPARKAGTANAGDYSASVFEDDFITLVADYVKTGGSVIVCGLADYQDKGAVYGAEGHAAAQMNKLLTAIGSTMSINDDEVYDTVNNGGQAYRLYPENFNTDSAWCAGIVEGQTYSQYSGCSVNPGSGTWLVKGFETTCSVDSDKDGAGSTDEILVDGSYTYNIVVPEGQVVFLAAEETPYGGTIFAAGGVFLSDFEVKAELDNIWDLPYANRTIYENILGITRQTPAVTPIADVRASAAAELGRIFVIEGYVTAGTANENTKFFDAIYVQDETGGITVFPYSELGLELGTKVRITGYTDAYQDDIEIQILSCEILDEDKNVITPEKMSNKEAMDYDTNGGELIQVQGEVVSVELSNGVVSQFVVKDEKGDEAKVFIDGYILSGTTGKNELASIVKVGNTVSAVGLLYKHPEGNSTVSVAVLRVRDCDEVVLIKAAEPDEPTSELTSEPTSEPTMAPTTEPATKPTTDSTKPTTQPTTDSTTGTTSATTSSGSTNSNTGDNSMIAVSMAVMAAALIGLAILLANRKRWFDR